MINNSQDDKSRHEESPEVSTKSEDLNTILYRLETDFHDYHDGRWNFNGQKPIEIAKTTIEQLVRRSNRELLERLDTDISKLNKDYKEQYYGPSGKSVVTDIRTLVAELAATLQEPERTQDA